MNDVLLCGAPTVHEIRITLGQGLLSDEAHYWKEALEGMKTSDLDENKIEDLKKEVQEWESACETKDEAIAELEEKIQRIERILKSLSSDLDECKRSKLYPIVEERIKKIGEILKGKS